MKTESAIIIGNGNVAFHLEKWLTAKGVCARRVSSRTFLDAGGRPISPASIYIISVSDDAILTVAEPLEGKIPDEALVVHTSGSMPCGILGGFFPNYGVLYPMQTFSRDRSLEYVNIPLFVEGGDEAVTTRLEAFARRLSPTVHRLDSPRRRALHIAAVFACNYLNRMLVHANEALSDCPFSLEVLAPLIEETVAKALAMDPRKAQTGPARRGDASVIRMHQHQLANRPATRELYTLIAKQISDDYGLRPE